MTRLALLALLVIGCGTQTPVDGAACAAGSAPKCSSSSAATFCENGRWVEFSCGASPCIEYPRATDNPDAGTQIKCLFVGIDAGAPCPLSGPAPHGWCDDQTKTAYVCVALPSGGGEFVTRGCDRGCITRHDGDGIVGAECAP